MYEFTALVYTGIKQQLVSVQASSRDEFEQYLTGLFGVYVCIWQSYTPVTSHHA